MVSPLCRGEPQITFKFGCGISFISAFFYNIQFHVRRWTAGQSIWRAWDHCLTTPHSWPRTYYRSQHFNIREHETTGCFWKETAVGEGGLTFLSVKPPQETTVRDSFFNICAWNHWVVLTRLHYWRRHYNIGKCETPGQFTQETTVGNNISTFVSVKPLNIVTFSSRVSFNKIRYF